MAKGNHVAYYRVSTAKQGQSGLGLDAQRHAVADYLNGGRWTLLREFTEVESGKRDDNRPQLQAALAYAKATGSTLVVAKIDRLSRNVAFIATLMDSGVDFVAADMPMANRLTVHVLAAVAEHEREAISQRTKVALQAAKQRGVRLGNPHGARALRAAGRGNAAATAAIKRKADEHAADIVKIIDDLKTQGITGLGSIAKALNNDGILTARGKRWHKTTVANILRRVGEL
jgi:DNA invertase Pin-like site-specific DNA recombinase